MQAKRAEIEADIQGRDKQLNGRRQGHGRAAAPPASTEVRDKSGLIRVRHPNRDFFLADLFDYASRMTARAWKRRFLHSRPSPI